MMLPMRAVGCIRSIHASKVLGTSSLLPLLLSLPLLPVLLPLLPVLSVVMLLVSVSSTDEDGDDGCVCDTDGNGGRGWANGSL